MKNFQSKVITKSLFNQSLKIKCPHCSREFTSNLTQLEIEGKVKCPSCQASFTLNGDVRQEVEKAFRKFKI